MHLVEASAIESKRISLVVIGSTIKNTALLSRLLKDENNRFQDKPNINKRGKVVSVEREGRTTIGGSAKKYLLYTEA